MGWGVGALKLLTDYNQLKASASAEETALAATAICDGDGDGDGDGNSNRDGVGDGDGDNNQLKAAAKETAAVEVATQQWLGGTEGSS